MKRMQRFVFLALVLSVGAVRVSAGGGQQSGGQQAKQDLGARGSGPMYWLVKYPQTVTLHSVNEESSSMQWRDGDSITGNAYTRGIKQYLNIDIVTDWMAANSNDYTTKLNLAIASKQIPDFFSCNAVQFSQLLDAGMIADITDYIENNIADPIKKTMDADPDVTNSAKKNGRLYAVPQYSYGPMDDPWNMWIRKDWRDAAKLAAPKTIAELETLMQTFMRAHPGSYGMPLNSDLSQFNRLASSFGAYPAQWITGSNGSIVYGSIQPEMKQVLQTFADWYKKGYLKQDWMSSNSESNRTDIIAGKFGVQLNGSWLGQTADMIKNYGQNAYFDAFELPSATGKPVMHPRAFDNGGYIVINKNCGNIAAVLKCISYYGGGVYGNEFASAGFGTTEEIWDAHGYSNGQHIMPMIKVNDLLGERQIYDDLQEMKRTGNPQVLKHPSAQNSYNNGIVPFLAGDLSGWGPDRWAQMWADNCAYTANKSVVDENRFTASRMQGPVPEEVAAYGSSLDDILAEGFTQIIVGQQPVSYFDTLVGRWKSAGGDNCTRVINRVYGSK